MKLLLLVFISANCFGQVIPKPIDVQVNEGTINLNEFAVTSAMDGQFPLRLANYVSDNILYNFDMPFPPTGKSLCFLNLHFDSIRTPRDAYKLEIKKDEINIYGMEECVFRGLQTSPPTHLPIQRQAPMSNNS